MSKNKAYKTFIKSQNGAGGKCKTYITHGAGMIVFEKITLYKDKIPKVPCGGEIVIKKTDNYTLTIHWFAIKTTTLIKGFLNLNIFTQ